MDIQKSGNCKVLFCLALVAAVVLIAVGISFAETRDATEALIKTYTLAPAVTPAEIEQAIAGLENVLSDCVDSYPAFRTRYRMGVLYFKAGMMEASKSEFLQIANDPECSELIRACSFNMVGQISRLKGKDEDALEAFDRVANLLEQRLAVDNKKAVESGTAKLWCSAVFGKAEIYELQRDYAASIAEYNRLHRILDENENNDMLSKYAVLANDRISQLYLRLGDADKYIRFAQALTADYPKYCRTPIIKFEIECVRFLKNLRADFGFANGSFIGPACLIAYLKDSKDKTSAQQISSKLDTLCKEYPGSYAGILLNYHYAWLLDTLGEEEKAIEILARISSSDIVDSNNNFWEKAIAETIQEYAKTQYAIMLSEKADYAEALRVLSSLRTHPGQSHLSELAKSIRKSIKILKREAPKK